MTIRRNAVVLHEAAVSHFLPARVVRRVDGTHVEIIDTLDRCRVVADAALRPCSPADVEHVDARGRVQRMPTLRRLKRHAAWYTPSVWRRDRRSRARRDFDTGRTA